MKKTLPETIRIRFTESDRQKADNFLEPGSCLVATALKRMGYSKVSEGIDDCTIKRTRYLHDWFGCFEAQVDHSATQKPHYRPGVVGKTLTLRRASK